MCTGADVNKIALLRKRNKIALLCKGIAMKLSTKGRYAMVALADLALQPAGTLVNLTEISKRQDVSLAYLEQLFVKLRRAELVISVRGPGGGVPVIACCV